MSQTICSKFMNYCSQGYIKSEKEIHRLVSCFGMFIFNDSISRV